MNHIEAMKQALKALEKCSAQLARLGYSANHADQIIPALRTAIAEAESRATEQMEKQRSANEHLEPVAVVSGYYGGQCVVLPTNPARLFNSGTAFYTTPPAAQPAYCTWTQVDDMHMPDTWQADCGAVWTFTEGGPADNYMKFCPKCGKHVEQKGGE